MAQVNRVDDCVDGFPKKPPGSLWRHPETGRWHWKVRRPGDPPGTRKNVAMIPLGKRTATRVKGIAEKCRKRLWKQWTADGPNPVPRDMEEWVKQFEAWGRMSASEQHAHYNAQVARRFINQQNIKHAWQIDVECLQEYLQWIAAGDKAAKRMALSPGTQRRQRTALSRFCRFLMIKRQLEVNPAAACEVQRVYKRPPRFLPTNQVSNLLKRTKGSKIHAAVVFGLETGLRLSEMRALRWRDVSGVEVIVGAEVTTKTFQWRSVPITEKAREALGEPGNPADRIFLDKTPTWYVEQLTALTKELPVFGELKGGVGNQWHLLRSTFAVNQARAGKNLWELMALLGHSTPQTTMRYVNIAQAAGVTH